MMPKWLTFRYKLFRYHHVAQEVAQRPQTRRLLDVGCGDGEYLLRFRHLPLHLVGLEVSWPRLRRARRLGLDVLQGDGGRLPWLGKTFDMVYMAHVLHHVAPYEQVLAEIARVLTPDGRLFLVETVTDNPLLRLGRRLHPVWQGDVVEAAWRYDDLVRILRRTGLVVEQSGRYNVFFFMWEMLPLAFWPFELFTPFFVYLDLLLARFFQRYSAHCYFVLKRDQSGNDA